MTGLKLLYKSFYDLTFVREYIKNGRGTGISIMALVALIMTIIVATPVAPKFIPLFNEKNVEQLINGFYQSIPPIVIEDGELQWEEDDYKVINLDKKNKIIIDTKTSIPSINQISQSFLYLTKTDVYINSKGKFQSASWREVQEAFDNENPLDLTSEKMAALLAHAFKYVMIGFLIVATTFTFLTFWLVNSVLSALTRIICSTVYKRFKELNAYEIRRTATSAVTPILLVLAITKALTGFPGFWLKAIIVIVLGIFIMTRFIPNNTNNEKA